MNYRQLGVRTYREHGFVGGLGVGAGVTVSISCASGSSSKSPPPQAISKPHRNAATTDLSITRTNPYKRSASVMLGRLAK